MARKMIDSKEGLNAKCYEMALICGYASNNCCLGEQSEKCYLCPYYCDTFGNSPFSLRR